MKTARMISNMRKKGIKLVATEEDIKRNLELLKKGNSLDIPLTVLDGRLKSNSYFTEATWQTKTQRNACSAFYITKRKKRLEYKVEWCLWFLYYYIKLKESKKWD